MLAQKLENDDGVSESGTEGGGEGDKENQESGTAGDKSKTASGTKKGLAKRGAKQASAKKANDMNDPFRFQGDGVDFRAKLIGIRSVDEPRGDAMCQASLNAAKGAVKASGQHKQKIFLNVSLDGLKIKDQQTSEILHKFPVSKISFIARDTADNRAFGFIYGTPDDKHQFYAIKTEKTADNVVLSIKDMFHIVFEMKKKQRDLVKSGQAEPAEGSNAAAKEEGVKVADLLDLESEINDIQQGIAGMESAWENFDKDRTNSTGGGSSGGMQSPAVQDLFQSPPFSPNASFGSGTANPFSSGAGGASDVFTSPISNSGGLTQGAHPFSYHKSIDSAIGSTIMSSTASNSELSDIFSSGEYQLDSPQVGGGGAISFSGQQGGLGLPPPNSSSNYQQTSGFMNNSAGQGGVVLSPFAPAAAPADPNDPFIVPSSISSIVGGVGVVSPPPPQTISSFLSPSSSSTVNGPNFSPGDNSTQNQQDPFSVGLSSPATLTTQPTDIFGNSSVFNPAPTSTIDTAFSKLVGNIDQLSVMPPSQSKSDPFQHVRGPPKKAMNDVAGSGKGSAALAELNHLMSNTPPPTGPPMFGLDGAVGSTASPANPFSMEQGVGSTPAMGISTSSHFNGNSSAYGGVGSGSSGNLLFGTPPAFSTNSNSLSMSASGNMFPSHPSTVLATNGFGSSTGPPGGEGHVLGGGGSNFGMVGMGGMGGGISNSTASSGMFQQGGSTFASGMGLNGATTTGPIDSFLAPGGGGNLLSTGGGMVSNGFLAQNNNNFGFSSQPSTTLAPFSGNDGNFGGGFSGSANSMANGGGIGLSSSNMFSNLATPPPIPPRSSLDILGVNGTPGPQGLGQKGGSGMIGGQSGLATTPAAGSRPRPKPSGSLPGMSAGVTSLPPAGTPAMTSSLNNNGLSSLYASGPPASSNNTPTSWGMNGGMAGVDTGPGKAVHSGFLGLGGAPVGSMVGGNFDGTVQNGITTPGALATVGNGSDPFNDDFFK